MFYDTTTYDGLTSVTMQICKVYWMHPGMSWTEAIVPNSLNLMHTNGKHYRPISCVWQRPECLCRKGFLDIGNPIAVFISYGELRRYWSSATVRAPQKFPRSMVNIVAFLYNSPPRATQHCHKSRCVRCKDRI